MDVQRVGAKAQAVRAAVAEELMAVETAAVRKATAVSGEGWSVTRVVAATLSFFDQEPPTLQESLFKKCHTFCWKQKIIETDFQQRGEGPNPTTTKEI